MLVVASLGNTTQHRWLLGSVAERVAQTSPVPVLIVRESDSIEAWARGKRPLRATVGAKLAPIWGSVLELVAPRGLSLDSSARR